MIDAATFSSTYNAFWNDVAPTLEHFVRRLNLEHVERFAIPLKSSETKRRALIAEFAFSIFVENSRKNQKLDEKDKRYAEAWMQTVRRMKPFLGQGLDLEEPLSDEEQNEVEDLVDRLALFFVGQFPVDMLRPIFRGCGFLDASEADIYFNDTLFEVKTVERAFRGSDLKQLLSYAALNRASADKVIARLGLVNPRLGISFSMNIDEISREISGRSSEELLSIVIQTVSSGEISR